MGGRWRYKLIVSVNFAIRNTEIHKFMGGRWRYKLIVCVKLTNFTIQQNYGWMLALQTYSVLQVYKVYNTKIHKLMGGRWRYNGYKLVVSLKFTKYNTDLCVDVGVTAKPTHIPYIMH